MHDPSGRSVSILVILLCALFLHPGLGWADDKDKEKVPEVDPYTKEKPKEIKALGYERFGPFDITPTHSTQDVMSLIGAEWMLWVETPHFKIGSTLGKRPISAYNQEAYKRLHDELSRLRKKIPRVKKRPKELDEWLTLHLYAQRLEELYADMASRFGVKEEAPPVDLSDPAPYTGWGSKFVVLLFEQKGNLARYLARYVGVTCDRAYRHLFKENHEMLFATNREDYSATQDPETAFFTHITANMVRSLINSYGGYRYRLPLWWGEGLTHWYVRRIDPQYYYPTTAQGQKTDYRRDHEWEKKVYARIKSNYYRPAKELLATFDPKEMKFADHMMAWSRVDFLFTLGQEKTGTFMQHLKGLAWVAGIKEKDVLEMQAKGLKAAWNFDADTLDKAWTAWVLKAYKKHR